MAKGNKTLAKIVKRKKTSTARKRVSRFRKQKPITYREIWHDLTAFYSRLEPLIRKWRRTEGEKKTKLMQTIKDKIKLQRRIMQLRISASFPPFERHIIDLVFTLSTTGVKKENVLKVAAQVLDFVKKQKRLSDADVRKETLALFDRLAEQTRGIELMGGEAVNWFFKQFPEKHKFFMECLEVFSGAENVYHTNISTYLELCKMYIEQGK